MSVGGSRTKVEMELDELREKGLTKSHKNKYSRTNAAPLSTPEQAFAFLAAQKAARKMKSKVEPPKNLNSNDLDSWFMQQRAQNAEMKRKRMEAAAILRGYRASSSGLQNQDFTGSMRPGSYSGLENQDVSGSMKTAASASDQREVIEADAKSTAYGESIASPGKLVLPNFLDKGSESVAARPAGEPQVPPTLEDEDEEADSEDDENLEELMKVYMDAKEAEGAPVPVNEEGEVDADALLKEEETSDDAVASTKEDPPENDDELKEENSKDISDDAAAKEEGKDVADVTDVEESVDKDSTEKSNDASDINASEGEPDAAAVKEEIVEENEEILNEVGPDPPAEDKTEKVVSGDVGAADADGSKGAADTKKVGDNGASNEAILAEGDAAAEALKTDDKSHIDEPREENDEEINVVLADADDGTEMEEKKSDDSDLEQKEQESANLAWRERISSEAGAKFPLESGRYHLYASYACPWAHRALMVWALKGLEEAISTTVVHPIWRKTDLDNPDDQHIGWVFGNPDGEPFRNTAGLGGPFPPAYPGNEPDPIFNAFSVRELYECANDTLGKYTLPLLWDKKLNTIVNNESSDILRILNSDFNEVAKNPDLDLYPKDQRGDIEKVNEWVHPSLNNAVYKCGFATSQEAYDNAIDEITKSFDKVDSILQKQRYITGDNFNEADVRLFVTLLRWDEVSSLYMKTNTRSVATTPAILNYCRDIYRIPGVAKTCHMDQIKAHYYCSHVELNRYSIIPRGPDFMDLLRETNDEK